MANNSEEIEGKERRPEGSQKNGRDKRERSEKRSHEHGRARKHRESQGSSPLKAGLFSSIADKQVACRVEGCPHTWTWFAWQQIRSLGQPPPERMCDTHLAQLHEIHDQEIPCRNPECSNTWTWKRGAQLAQMQRDEPLTPPSRLCERCFAAERDLQDKEVACKVEGCKRVWTWTKDAQLRHRAWLRRQKQELETKQTTEEAGLVDSPPPAAETEQGESLSATEQRLEQGTGEENSVAVTESEVEPQKRKKKRKKSVKQAKLEGPPERMCEVCTKKLKRLSPKKLPCKVYGCSNTWEWDRASQLKAWVMMGGEDLQAESPPQKRMCESCREFCRQHADREVACGRPDCDKTWTYKTGAQLQAFLAGKKQDPLKLCDSCARGGFLEQAKELGLELPEGAEKMPCIVHGCQGSWVYLPGQKVSTPADGELPFDRMCNECQSKYKSHAQTKPETESTVAAD